MATFVITSRPNDGCPLSPVEIDGRPTKARLAATGWRHGLADANRPPQQSRRAQSCPATSSSPSRSARRFPEPEIRLKYQFGNDKFVEPTFRISVTSSNHSERRPLLRFVDPTPLPGHAGFFHAGRAGAGTRSEVGANDGDPDLCYATEFPPKNEDQGRGVELIGPGR